MIIKVDIKNHCFLAVAVLGFDELRFVQMLDELFDIFPACLFDVVKLGLLSSIDW
jgi:hypothetical protein